MKNKMDRLGRFQNRIEPGKKLQTAETEIYRLVMSNGTRDDLKVSVCMSGV